MGIEHEVLDIATMTSNAIRWKSEISGGVGIPMQRFLVSGIDIGEIDDGAHHCQSEDEYVDEILSFLDNLQIFDLSMFELPGREEELAEVKAFIKRAAAASPEGLEALARMDWKERLADLDLED